MTIAEIQASLLEVTADKEGKQKHSKHVQVIITDPKICALFQSAVEDALAKEQKALGIADADALTLETCEDASSFTLTGKTSFSEAEKKHTLAHQVGTKKKKAADKPAA